MENLVPLGTGNSRFMKSNISPSTPLAQLISMLNNGTFPYDVGTINPAGISQQGTPLNKDTLLKDATAGLYGLGSDAVPDDVLSKLSKSILYYSTATPKYQEVTVNLETAQPGDNIRLNYNGKLVNHIVLHKGLPGSMYDPSCNGVWLLREDVVDTAQWGSSNSLPGSNIMSTMAEYLGNYSADIQQAIKTVKIPYCIGGGSATVNSGANGLECKLFPLSGYELGLTQSDSRSLPIDGNKLDYFLAGDTTEGRTQRIAYLNGEAVHWWTRSPVNDSSGQCIHISNTGRVSLSGYGNEYGIRPAFIMPSSFTVTYYVDSQGNLHDEQEYEEAGSTTDVKGNPITIGAQIATGSYMGTGGYGKSNENVLTVGEKAKVVLISGGDLNSYKQYSTYMGIFFPCFLPADYPTTAATSTSGFVYLNNSQGVVTQNKALFSNGTLKWFSADDQLKQLNGANFTYGYVILS